MAKMQDKDLANSILNDYKLMCRNLNIYITESQNNALRNDYIKMLQSTYNCQKQLFDSMNQKGWYPVDSADMADISRVQNQYGNVQL
ncbi:MAG: spore coat protein [Firmicutes bacterium HGW-Firmicutes-13]|nr:MAG: spore coat protein [Firmicutes bacterium HGW-Firmicutes-13]